MSWYSLLFAVLCVVVFLLFRGEEGLSRRAPEVVAKNDMSSSPARSAVVIFLHGLGDTGAGWSALPGSFRGRAGASSWRFTMPTAPQRAVTCNGGARTHAWMDLEEIPVLPDGADDAAGFTASAKIIHALIDAEVAKGTAVRDVFLGGFSQGAAMSLWAGLSYPKGPLGGVIGMSGWWPATMSLPNPPREGERVLLCHGRSDGVVVYACRDAAAEKLKARGGIAIETQSFSGGHEFHNDEPAWLHAFIMARLNQTD